MAFSRIWGFPFNDGGSIIMGAGVMHCMFTLRVLASYSVTVAGAFLFLSDSQSRLGSFTGRYGFWIKLPKGSSFFCPWFSFPFVWWVSLSHHTGIHFNHSESFSASNVLQKSLSTVACPQVFCYISFGLSASLAHAEAVSFHVVGHTATTAHFALKLTVSCPAIKSFRPWKSHFIDNKERPCWLPQEQTSFCCTLFSAATIMASCSALICLSVLVGSSRFTAVVPTSATVAFGSSRSRTSLFFARPLLQGS